MCLDTGADVTWLRESDISLCGDLASGKSMRTAYMEALAPPWGGEGGDGILKAAARPSDYGCNKRVTLTANALSRMWPETLPIVQTTLRL